MNKFLSLFKNLLKKTPPETDGDVPERSLTELDEDERHALEDEIHRYDFALLDGSMSREEHNKIVRKLIDDAFRMHDRRK